tara:strand:+ start:554 stop:1645 length:1092 start_codon:yes stop_codon:yes gene_type:complete
VKNSNNIYLSVVAASRNDNHGDRLDERTNIFIKSLAENCKKYKILAELILVEWNQIPNTKTLSERLDLISNEYLNSKIITVNQDYHLKLQNSDRLQFFQMIAKNVGIRRASGNFVLATNIDVIINQKIYEFISQKKLKEKTIYRCDRHCVAYDYSGNITDDYLDQFTNFIDKKYYSVDKKSKIKHYVNSSFYKYLKNFLIGVFERKDKSLIQKISFKNLKSILKKITLYLKYYRVLPIFFFQKKIYTNACGDFTLLDKNSWIDLKGYCELPIYSWHLDSLFLWEARFKKYKFFDFDENHYIYHMNHNFSGVISEKEKMFQKLKDNKIPYLTNEEFLDLALKLSKNPNYLKTNEFWGLHNINLS